MARNLEAARQYSRDRRRNEPERVREVQRRSRAKTLYGMTLEEYEAALAQPCAICGGVSQVMDHDHASNVRRKALCSNCNVALGLMADDPQRLLAAAEYLGVHLGQEA